MFDEIEKSNKKRDTVPLTSLHCSLFCTPIFLPASSQAAPNQICHPLQDRSQHVLNGGQHVLNGYQHALNGGQHDLNRGQHVLNRDHVLNRGQHDLNGINMS